MMLAALLVARAWLQSELLTSFEFHRPLPGAVLADVVVRSLDMNGDLRTARREEM